MGVDPSFLFAAQRCIGFVRRRILDRLARQVDRQLRLRPIDIINPFRRDDHFVAQPPITRVDDDVADCPSLLIDYYAVFSDQLG